MVHIYFSTHFNYECQQNLQQNYSMVIRHCVCNKIIVSSKFYENNIIVFSIKNNIHYKEIMYQSQNNNKF